MENVGYAALQVIPSLKGFDSSLEHGTSGPLTSVGRRGGAKFGDAAGRSAASSMRSHLTRAAGFIIGGFVGAEAIRKTADILRDSLDEARDSNKVAAVTDARIKSTGKSANLTAKQIGKLSTALSNKVGIDDEVIQRGANMLLTFTNIRNGTKKTNDIFTQATSITTDLAASMAGGNGGEPDLKSASILVGKALNDPVKGLTALTRVGVSFTDQQKKQITALVDGGNSMKAQKIILGELNKEFGGTAKAQATVGDKLKVAFSNVEESLGKKLLPEVQDFQRFLLQKGIPAAQDFVKWFGREGAPQIDQFVDSARPLVKSLLPAVGHGFKDIAGFLKDASGPAKSVIDAFNSLPDWAQKSIVLGAGAGVLAKKTGALSFGKTALTGGGGVLGLVSKSKPVPVFVTNPGLGGGGVPGGGGKGGGLAAIPLIGSAIAAGFASKQFADNERAREQQKFGTNDLIDIAKIKLERDLAAKGLAPGGTTAIKVGDLTIQLPGEPAKLGIKALTDRSDSLKQHLGQASTALDLVSRHGSQTFGGLSTKIDGTSTRTDILDRKLRGLPKSLRTELALDDREARRKLAAFRLEAQRSLALELAPGPHMGRPGDSSLDGVRR